MKKVWMFFAVVSIAGFLTAPASAAEVLIPGKIGLVKPGKQGKFVSKAKGLFPGDAFPLPLAGGEEDPSLNGATLRLFDTDPNVDNGGDATFSLPAGAGWKSLGNPPGSKGYKYKGAGTPGDPCRVVLIKEKVIKAVCKSTPFPLTTPFVDGDFGIRLLVGTALEYCAEFGGTALKDDSKLLKRKDAGAPTACPELSPPTTETETPIPPTDTPAAPTDTPAAPTDTPAPPTDTPAPPTDTPAAPTDTPAAPTDTPAAPTDTPAPPTDTPAPPTDTPTDTPQSTETPTPTNTPAPTQQTFCETLSADDGNAHLAAAFYPPTGTVSVNTTGHFADTRRSLSGGNYRVGVLLLRFDTAGLPDDAVITAAQLEAYVNPSLGIGDTDGRSLVGEFYSTTNWPIDAGDYTATAPTASLALNTALSALTTGPVAIPLDVTEANLSVSKTGTTGLRLHISGGQPTGPNYVEFATQDNLIQTEPCLVIEYVTP